MKVNGVDVVSGVEDKILDWEREGRTVILVSVDGEFISRLASIPGRVFAFITVRRTTGPGTSCLRMRQSFVRF